MKEKDIKNLGFNEETTKILLDINKSEDDYFKWMMYSLEDSQRPYGKHGDLSVYMQQFRRTLADNFEEVLNIKCRDGIFKFQIIKYNEKGQMIDVTSLEIVPGEKKAILKMPTGKVNYSYKDGEFNEIISEKTL